MRARALLIAVLAAAIVANALLALDVFVGGALSLNALAGAPSVEERKARDQQPSLSETGAREAEAAYRTLITELTDQKQVLDKKAQELAERERQVAVIRQELAAKGEQVGAGPDGAPAGRKPAAAQSSENFKKLVKAYSGMEPENAARALLQVYEKDRDVAVDLILALAPRKAAAILDAVTVSKPAVAADLSLEVSQRDEPPAQ